MTPFASAGVGIEASGSKNDDIGIENSDTDMRLRPPLLVAMAPGIPGVRSMCPSLSNSTFVKLHWTLADEDTNSILTDNANRAIQGNVAMQITQSGCQLWN